MKKTVAIQQHAILTLCLAHLSEISKETLANYLIYLLETKQNKKTLMYSQIWNFPKSSMLSALDALSTKLISNSVRLNENFVRIVQKHKIQKALCGNCIP